MAFPQVSIPKTKVRYIQSTIVGDEFKIYIALPANYRSTNKTYPVLYFTDANWTFALVTQIARFMQLGKELPQIIFVGIGYRIG
ncbi:MAG: alpha/beta hydrolase-fold protein, partial [Bacteroidota bacterium]